jgi:hypothetical protein
MTSRARTGLWIVVAVALGVAALRGARARSSRSTARPPQVLLRLPATLDGQLGVVEMPTASDALLDGKRNVRIERRRYGAVAVALSTVRAGVREHHPPAVCLRASGYEITRRREQRAAASCLVLLELRREGRKSAFVYTYIDQRGRRSCSLWRRVVDAGSARLLGRPAPTWATLQVLAPDVKTASQRARDILDSQEKRP